MRTCGYESKTKFEACMLPAGHVQRHFDYGKDQQPMMFSIKAFTVNELKKLISGKKPARHVCGAGSPCHKYHN